MMKHALYILVLSLITTACVATGDNNKKLLQGDRITLFVNSKEEIPPQFFDAKANHEYKSLSEVKLDIKEIAHINHIIPKNHLTPIKKLNLITRPVISESQIFVITNNGLMSAYDKKNHSLQWSIRFAEKYNLGNLRNNSTYLSGSMTLAGDKLFVAIGNNYIAAVDSNSGALLWKTMITRIARGEILVLKNCIVVASVDNTIYILNKENGTIMWASIESNQDRTEISTLQNSSLVKVDTDIPSMKNSLFIHQNNRGELVALSVDQESYHMKEIWKLEPQQFDAKISSDALVNEYRTLINKNGRIFANFGNGSIISLDPLNARLIWNYYYDATKSIHAGEKYLYSLDSENNVFAISQDNGAVIWKSNVPKMLEEYQKFLENLISSDSNNKKLYYSLKVIKQKSAKLKKLQNFEEWYPPITYANLLILAHRNGTLLGLDINTGLLRLHDDIQFKNIVAAPSTGINGTVLYIPLNNGMVEIR